MVCTEQTEGIITHYVSQGTGQVIKYAPCYKFLVNGVEYKERSSHFGAKYKSEIITVYYNSDDPTKCFIKGEEKKNNIAVIVISIVGVLVVIYSFVRKND